MRVLTYHSYFDNAAHCDVTIHFRGGKVHAHKVMLAAQSEHFYKMFESGFMETSARDVHLKEDDPDALFGLLAWCYGLLCIATSCVAEEHTVLETQYHGSDFEDHLKYIAELYVTADKYTVPALKAHAKKHFNLAMQGLSQRCTRARKEVMGAELLLADFEDVTTLVYNTLAEGAGELRAILVKTVHGQLHDLMQFEDFKGMMLRYPKLSFDVATAGMLERGPRVSMTQTGNSSSSLNGAGEEDPHA